MPIVFAVAKAAHLTVDLNVDPIAVLAAIISLASLVVSVAAIRRDRPKVRITYRKGWLIVNPAPGYKPKTPYFGVTVSNRGTRPVTIGSVAAQSLKENGGFIFSDSMINGVRELTQGKSMDCLVEMKEYEAHEQKEGIAYIVVSDLTGKAYKKSMAPFYARTFYWPIRKYKGLRKRIVMSRKFAVFKRKKQWSEL